MSHGTTRSDHDDDDDDHHHHHHHDFNDRVPVPLVLVLFIMLHQESMKGKTVNPLHRPYSQGNPSQEGQK